MRQEIQYALSLTNWLGLEGVRHGSLETLWPHLVFVAERLGFTSMSLTLADGVRAWQKPDATGPTQCCRQELRGGAFGVLELKAPASQSDERQFPDADRTEDKDAIYGRSISDPKLFEILTELVAEGWLKATKRWENRTPAPLNFSSKPFGPVKLRRTSPPLPPVRVNPEVLARDA